MIARAADPIGELTHTHASISKLALAVGEHVRALAGSAATPEQHEDLDAKLEMFGDALLHHFADEEEALFPFVRCTVPAKADVIDALEASHDMICGAVVRLAHVARNGGGEQLLALYERFERAYAQHSADEARLLEELERELGSADRAALAAALQA
jgi:hypothetical protein